MIAECGGVVGYGMDGDSAHSNWSGMGWGSALAAINGTGKSPGMGTQWKGCFRNDTSCGCYNTNGCLKYVTLRSWRIMIRSVPA